MHIVFTYTEPLEPRSNADFRELDINPAWARVFSQARNKLRREALRNLIPQEDFETFNEEKEEEEEDNRQTQATSLQLPSNCAVNTHSWRHRVGSQSR